MCMYKDNIDFEGTLLLHTKLTYAEIATTHFFTGSCYE